jgi:hypothetical protein
MFKLLVVAVVVTGKFKTQLRSLQSQISHFTLFAEAVLALDAGCVWKEYPALGPH